MYYRVVIANLNDFTKKIKTKDRENMTIKYGTLLLLSIFQSNASWLSNSLFCLQKPKRHDYITPLPDPVKIKLDEHYADFKDSEANVHIFDWLPGFVIKYGTYRIEAAKRFAETIDALKSRKLFVPKKYIYRAPNGTKYTIAEFIQESDKKITKYELKEVMKLAKKMRWVDAHSGNVFKTNDDYIAIIDTEGDNCPIGPNNIIRHPFQFKFMLICKVSSLSLNQHAREYIIKKHKEYVFWMCPQVQDALEKKKIQKQQHEAYKTFFFMHLFDK